MNLINLVTAIFWFIVVLTHIGLMMKYLQWSRQKFASLPNRAKIAKINGISLGIKESIDDINDFIIHLNEHNHKTNIAHFWGYTTGFFVSLVALILSIQTL